MTIRMYDENGIEIMPTETDHTPVAIDKWYDRHRREWVLYPIDAEGNQVSEAVYAFSKAEATTLKAELEIEYGIA